MVDRAHGTRKRRWCVFEFLEDSRPDGTSPTCPALGYRASRVPSVAHQGRRIAVAERCFLRKARRNSSSELNRRRRLKIRPTHSIEDEQEPWSRCRSGAQDGFADNGCEIWVFLDSLEIFAVRQIDVCTGPITRMANPNSFGVEDAEREDVRQSRHVFVEEKIERLPRQFFQVAIRRRFGMEFFGDADEYKVNGLDRALRQFR